MLLVCTFWVDLRDRKCSFMSVAPPLHILHVHVDDDVHVVDHGHVLVDHLVVLPLVLPMSRYGIHRNGGISSRCGPPRLRVPFGVVLTGGPRRC